MTNATLLKVGIVIFTLLLVGFGLTLYEFSAGHLKKFRLKSRPARTKKSK